MCIFAAFCVRSSSFSNMSTCALCAFFYLLSRPVGHLIACVAFGLLVSLFLFAFFFFFHFSCYEGALTAALQQHSEECHVGCVDVVFLVDIDE